MRVWITKYALTVGIYCANAERNANISPDMITICHNNRYPQHFHGEGKDWHQDHDAAVSRAEKMRIDKIASLKKQITKLEKLTFE